MMNIPPHKVFQACCLALVLAVVAQAHAQKAAERFIPLGRSPGLSGQTTLLGVIRYADPASGKLTLELKDGRAGAIAVTPATHIWVDRSLLRQANVPGGFDDLLPGRWLEAMPLAGDPGQAEWVKVEQDQP